MKKLISLVLSICLLVPILGTTFVSADTPKACDYTKEVQVNQFRPHGGDRQEISDTFDTLIKNLKDPKALSNILVSDSSQKSVMEAYLSTVAAYKQVKLVSAAADKLYTVANAKADYNLRAIVKFKYLGITNSGKTIEKTDYIGLAKLGKNPVDWKFWGVVWADSGIDVTDVKLVQLDKPKKGEEIVVITTTIGDIKLRLFPDKAPKTVKNFKTLAEKGYYNNTEFFRVINDFMIQGGSPDNTATGGESIYGKYFEDEFNHDLFNFRGALAMGNEGYANTNGSQFYIVQRPKADPAHLELSALPLNAEAKYLEIGGCPHLDMRYTVFGQAYEGIELVDKIAAVETDEEARPLKDPVKILKITFSKF